MSGLPHTIADDIKQVLLSAETIEERVAELGGRVSADYAGKDVLLVCVLKGAMVFMADLIRHITIPVGIDTMAVTSYGAATVSSGVVRIVKDLDSPIAGKHVLIVEDIVDSGLTLNYLRTYLANRKPASVKVCTLLDKPERREAAVTPDYCGFEIPNLFVVGYGLDYQERYRNLPFVGIPHDYVWAKDGSQDIPDSTLQEV
ncbi:MAG: Hypoxanthine-guanine phosphoribosyltransferase [Firmicutes bacterium ADurb.Bin506]|nr:MAG: Hypoxanthine-guanine phosphoribosyltransferase [Firmicutes bacterium ADurb.Bin506]